MPDEVKSASDYFREMTTDTPASPEAPAPPAESESPAPPAAPEATPSTPAPDSDPRPVSLEDVPEQLRPLIEARLAEVDKLREDVELKGKLQQGDYTRKTQEVAEQRKQLEALRAAYEAQVTAPPSADTPPAPEAPDVPAFPLDARFLPDDPDQADAVAQVLPALAEVFDTYAPQLVAHIESRLQAQVASQLAVIEPFVKQFALQQYAHKTGVDASALIALADRYQPGTLEQLDLLVETLKNKSAAPPNAPPGGGETPKAPKGGPVESPKIREGESAGDYYRRTVGHR